MALALLGVVDLSVITHNLIKLLNDSVDSSPLWKANGGHLDPFTIKVSGSMPESVRGDGDAQLSVYLFHLAQNPFQRNSPVLGRALPIPDQPMSLELYYLVTAFAKKDHEKEQQAMSIALRCFHENPFVRIKEVIGGTNVNEEFSLSMEIETIDKLSLMWQAISAHYRLSVLYKVSVVFITPDIKQPGPAPPVKEVLAAADAAAPLIAPDGQVFGTSATVTYLTPDSTVAHPKSKTIDRTPAVVAAGERFALYGENLDQPTAARIFLLMPDGKTEFDVTGWISTDVKVKPTKSRITLDVPAPGALPGGSPPPGIYQLRAGSTGFRTMAATFSIAAHVSVTVNPPILIADGGGVYAINGVGFVPGSTQVLAAGRLADSVTVAAGILTFKAPTASVAGLYAVRIVVNGVESSPALWIKV
ncbi:MAG TPA: DUF4255 domain-containing protein [Bryobacteraceae bacterium]